MTMDSGFVPIFALWHKKNKTLLFNIHNLFLYLLYVTNLRIMRNEL